MTTPTTSIIVPTFNRPDRLDRCLTGLAGLAGLGPDSGSRAVEVVIVDDGGPEPLDEVVRPHRRHLDVRLVRQDNAGPAAARNAGARNATGRILAFTDDDCVPDSGWLAELLRCHGGRPDVLVGGRTENALPANLCAQASQDLVAYLYDYYAGTTGAPAFFTSNNMLVDRDRFLTIGGFDTTFRLAAGEDRELCDRWLDHGMALEYAPDAVMRHFHNLDIRRFWRQHMNYGRGAFHFHGIRKARGEEHTIEPGSFYTRLMLYPLHQRRSILRAVAGAGLMALSQAANAAGYFREKFGSRA